MQRYEPVLNVFRGAFGPWKGSQTKNLFFSHLRAKNPLKPTQRNFKFLKYFGPVTLKLITGHIAEYLKRNYVKDNGQLWERKHL